MALILSSPINAHQQSTEQKNTEQPLRVVSLAPHITEMIYSAGAGHLLVGAVEYSDYPEAAKAIPRVGNHHAVNLEKIISLKPDFVFVWQSSARQQDIERFKKLGFKIIYSEVKNLNDIGNQVRQFGQTLNTEQTANQNALKIEQQLAQLKQNYQNKTPISVFYQIWDKPLMTINGKQFISQGLEVCGAKNVFNELPMLAAEVNLESILKRNPELFLLGGEQQTQQNWLNKWQQIEYLTAVKNKQIKTLNADLYQRPTERFIMNLEAMCEVVDKARADLKK